MNRKLVVVGLSAVLSTALIGLPVGAQPAAKAPAAIRTARVAPAGGILTKSKLQALGGTRSPDAWHGLPAMQQAVEENGGGAFAGNRGYVPGGFIEFTGPTLYDKMQIWTGAGWAVDNTDPIPLGGWGDMAVCADPSGKIHIVNGVDGAFLYAAHVAYDPAGAPGARWIGYNYPQLGTGETFYSQDSGCAFLGGRMYLFGGYAVVDPNPSAELTRVTWVWDPATDTWADANRLMNTGRIWMAYGNNAQVAYVAGGGGDLTTFNPVEAVERFAPASGWVNVAAVPNQVGGGRLASGLGTIAGYVFIHSGASQDLQGQFTLRPEVLFCTGQCTAWQRLPPTWNMIQPRWFNAWFSGGNKIYSAAGDDGSGTPIAAAERMP